jgi:hypothetical protein
VLVELAERENLGLDLGKAGCQGAGNSSPAPVLLVRVPLWQVQESGSQLVFSSFLLLRCDT